MVKKCVVKLESSRARKRKQETESKASGSFSSGIKRELEDSDANNDNQSFKRFKPLELDEEIAPSLASSIAALKIAFQNNPLLGTSILQTDYMIPPSHRPATLAMSIFEVRLTIFKHLPVPSLLQFALVSRDWYDETRSVLEKYKICAAVISGRQPCLDLLNLNNEIPWMTRIPVNSLNIKVFRGHQPCVSSHKIFDVEKFLGNILALPLKSLEMNRNRWMDSHCLASALLREAFRGRYPTMEKMIFPLLPPWRVYPREEDIFKEKSLPNLKYLECRMFKSSSKPLFLLALQVAPNIQEILTPFEVSSSKNEIESLTSNQLTFVKWLLLQPYNSVRPPFGRLANLMDLRRLEVMEPACDISTDRTWIKAVNRLLERSRSTLEYMSLANHELMLSLDTNVKPFPSLKYFQISIASMTDQLLDILDHLHLGQTFPNLTGLRIFFNQLSAKQAVDVDTFMGQLLPLIDDSRFPELWPSLTRLEFHVSPARSFSYGIFDYFAQNCPQITEFVYKGLGDKFLNYQIFTCFPQLQRLKLIVTANVANLDEILCGLDAEDVKDLRELPMEKLMQSHIVPRRHSISNLTDLKHFKLVISGAEKLGDSHRRQRSVLSHVTGVLIFSRLPLLKAEINCHLDNRRYMTCKALNHLSPMAKVNYIVRY